MPAFQSLLHNFDANILIDIVGDIVENQADLEKSCAATGHNSLFNSGASGRESILEAVLSLFELGLGSGANLDDCYSASELGKPLLQFFAIIRGIGRIDIAANKLNSALDSRLSPTAFHDRGVLFRNGHFGR
jgi:hypothetical protein